VAGVLIVLLLAGGFLFRGQIMGLVQAPAASTSTALPPATEQPATPTIQPTETVVSTSTSVPFAAFCQPDTLQVPSPNVRETNIDCIQKIPYTTVSIPLGAVFESLSSEMTCTVVKTQVEDVLISCTGRELFSYELKVCNPKPIIAASEPGRCPQDAGFNEADQCCVKPPAEAAGCTVFQVDLKSCSQ
jgi:hypothetical protein